MPEGTKSQSAQGGRTRKLRKEDLAYVHELLDVAEGLDERRAQQWITGIVASLLATPTGGGSPLAGILAPGAGATAVSRPRAEPAKAPAKKVAAPAAPKKTPPTPIAKGKEAAKESTREPAKAAPAPGKRPVGRPRKTEAVTKIAPKKAAPAHAAEERPGFDTDALIEHFKIKDSRTAMALRKFAENACKYGSRRGLPRTESPQTYQVCGRGGSHSDERIYVIDSKEHKVHHPVVAGKVDPTVAHIWIEHEMMLLAIRDKAPNLAESKTREQEISEYTGMTIRGIKWIEGIPSAKSCVPSIHAETARDILRGNKEFVSNFGKGAMDLMPKTLVTPKGAWTDEFSEYCRRLYYGKVELDRRERFALARLLMTPLTEIEYQIFRIGFPEKARKKEALPPGTKRGPGRPPKK